MEALPLSHKTPEGAQKMECNLRELCCIFAMLHVVGNASGCVYYIARCILLDTSDRLSDRSFMIYSVFAISFGLVLYRNLAFIDGLQRDDQRSIGSFITTIQCLLLVLALKVYFSYVTRWGEALDIIDCLDISYIAFIAISLVPLYFLYNKMKSEFYVKQKVDLPCFKSDSRSAIAIPADV